MEEEDIKKVLTTIEDTCGFFFTNKRKKELIKRIKRLDIEK